MLAITITGIKLVVLPWKGQVLDRNTHNYSTLWTYLRRCADLITEMKATYFACNCFGADD